jgi:anthranilate synthase component II
MDILLIDNYDSFTQNLRHAFLALGREVDVVRNDALKAEDALGCGARGIVLSPGPGTPSDSGICLDILKLAEKTNTPVLGVCLGHQALGQVFGGRIVPTVPVHGKVDSIFHNNLGLFKGLPSPFQATRYHSLAVERASLPYCLEITAETKEGLIMGLAHRTLKLYGVQFHPESVSSQYGLALLGAFLERCP